VKLSTVLMLAGAAVFAGLLVLAARVILLRRRPPALNQEHFHEKWQSLQQMLRDKSMWPEAVTNADELLGEALKKKRLRGGNMGERLVKAQRMLTDNDGVWFGHKLRQRLEHEAEFKPKETEVKQALLGIRQALKDLGALPDGQQRNKK
jgi:hypothetical protein